MLEVLGGHLQPDVRLLYVQFSHTRGTYLTTSYVTVETQALHMIG